MSNGIPTPKDLNGKAISHNILDGVQGGQMDEAYHVNLHQWKGARVGTVLAVNGNQCTVMLDDGSVVVATIVV